MKKLTFFFALVLLISSSSFAQQGLFSLGVNGGVMVPMGDFGDAYKVSPAIGLEAVYQITPEIDIVANAVYNILSSKYTYTNTTIYYIEGTAAARYNFVKDKGVFFGEAGIGMYDFSTKYTLLGTEYSSSSSDFGINLGVGGKYPIDKNLDLIGKIRFHNIFTKGTSTNYISLGAGINYNFR
jgi:hypothetical protein